MVCLILFAVVVLRNAWLSDDAFITFRTVDNFSHGYGLTWNVSERVQAYTHPLWMFLVSAASFYTGEIPVTTLLISAGLSVLAAGLLMLGAARTLWSAFLALGILSFSKAFVDYSTSGLENPLTHVLVVLFCMILLRRSMNGRTVLLLSVMAGLGTLNRMDTLLLFLPGLAYALWKTWSWRSLRSAAIGFIPFILWELFSIFYYGFPFPNTAYAKLASGLTRNELGGQGFSYLADSLARDPLTLSVIAAGMALPFFIRKAPSACIAAGASLYLVYLVWIGGDFMSGRFLTAPLLAACALVSHSTAVSRRLIALPGLALVILLGLASPHPPVFSGADYGHDYKAQTASVDRNGISDERAFYYPATGLLRVERGLPVPSPRHVWVAAALQARAEKRSVVVRNSVGFFGFFAGPGVHVLDELALGDPLLARLPPAWRSHWRIGHFFRDIPDGYVNTLASGHNELTDENLAAYYDRLSLIVRGPLLSLERLRAIASMNLGRSDHLIDQARYRFPGLLKVDLAGARGFAPSASGGAADSLPLPTSGIQISLGELSHTSRIELGVDSRHDFRIIQMRQDRAVATQTLWALPGAPDRLVTRQIAVAPRSARAGYDRLHILPGAGVGPPRLEHLRLLD
ncbi:MAG: hypothetical protein ACE5HD_01565 [Acidobacteriota bacterium]